MGNVTLEKWGLNFSNDKLFAVMGVNVLEGNGMEREVCEELKAITEDLKIPFVFKASFDKANRSNVKSYRGPGLEKGLQILADIKESFNVPVISDVHEVKEVKPASEVLDILQIPAFLCRQTDLVFETAKAAAQTGGLVHIKKMQTMAPWDMNNVVGKVKTAVPDKNITILGERGTSFGYNQMICDMLSIHEMVKTKAPVLVDASHATQLPGTSTDISSRQEEVKVIAKTGIVAGAGGVFLEFHPDPDKSLCDRLTCLPLSDARQLLTDLVKLKTALN